MKQELMKLLEPVTAEERRILDGQDTVERALYTSRADFTVDSRKMLSRGDLIDIRPHTRFVRFPRHRHKYIEIIYMCAGQTAHTINGRDKVTLQAGDLLFLNQHAWHEIEPAGRGDLAVNFIVLPEFFDVAFRMLEDRNVLSSFLIESLRREPGETPYLHFKVAKVLPVQNLVENMVWSIVRRQGGGRKINQITMGLLFLQLLDHTDKIEQGTAAQFDNVLVMDALREVEERYKDASLSALAQRHGQSLSRYSKLIRSATGSTFKELLQQARMRKAAELLQNTALSVSDIIAAVGYDNTSYFYRAFRESYGASPKEYRAGQGDKMENKDAGIIKSSPSIPGKKLV